MPTYVPPNSAEELDVNPTNGVDSEVSSLAGDPQTSYVRANMNGSSEKQEASAAQNPLDEDKSKLFDFNQAILPLRRIIQDWSAEIIKTTKNRQTRDVLINTEALRQNGRLDEDETIIPVRVIDTNIQREQPAYVNYLKNSRRLAIFNCLSEPELNTQKLEQEFTRGMTYQGWENTFFKVVDGAQTHGWDSVEVVFNPLFPLNTGVEHIGHDMLFFPISITDLQTSPEVIRAYDVTKLQLEAYVKDFGFDAEQVRLFFSTKKDTQKENETGRIYKRFCKHDGVVYVSWFSEKPETNNWLKKPEPAFIGIKEKQMVTVMKDQMVQQPVAAGPNGEMVMQEVMTQVPVQEEQWVNKPLTQYPIFLLPYRESEKPTLFNRKGRVYLDEAKQECQTAILSGFVNGLTRAANLYGAIDKDDGTGSSLKELNNVKMLGGRVFNKKVQFFQPDYPDPMVLRALQYLDVANTQEAGQVNYAVMNRDDSRKTATELDQANEQQALLNSVALTLFSTFMRQVLSFAWLIVQSQALQGNVALLLIEVPVPMVNPLNGQPVIDANTGQPVIQEMKKVNNDQVISQIYDVRAAGDVDVIQRDMKIQQMMQDWPVISQTPLAGQFLQDLMLLKYPDKGENYARILGQMDQIQMMQSMIARLRTVLEGSLQQNPESVAGMNQQDKNALMQLMAESAQFVPQGAQPQQK